MKIYTLTHITLKTSDRSDAILAKDARGAVQTRQTDLGAFSSVRKAEKMMADWLRHTKDWGEWSFGFILLEKAVDDGLRGPWNDVREFCSYRTYLGDGTFNCECDLDNCCEKKFAGRKTPAGVKEGEYCWVLGDSEILPALVSARPYTKDEWRQKFKRGAKGDYSDDCYLVMTPDGHTHPLSPDVFPFFGKLGKAVARKIESEKKAYFGKN